MSAKGLTLATVDALDGLAAASVRRLGSWILPQRDGSAPPLSLAPDGTITLLFGDLAGSTALNVRLGDDAFAALLTEHDRVVERHVERHGGRVVKTQGDGFLAAFHDPCGAVRAGLDLRDATRDRDVAEQVRVELRVGVHTGQAVTRGGDVFGENVALAARVASTARPGEVLVTSAVRERVEPAVDDLGFHAHLVPRSLKGIPGRHRLIRVERG